MRIYFWIGLLLAGLVPFSMKAQSLDRTIDGRVFGEELGKPQPLTGVRVQTLPSGSLALTDSLGAFTIQTNRETQALVFDYLGFQTDTIALGHAFDSVRLEPTLLMDELEISHRRKSTEINMLGARKTENIGERELLKAACCNLSESFETTPSVDVSITDAVTGYKQIQMLGLAGPYTFITRENIPDTRGLASITGLSFTPGTWIESMQLSKGTGSVVNGYESVAGQLNVEWRKPFETEEKNYLLNLYQSVQGRSEGNLVAKKEFSPYLSSNLFLHGRSQWLRMDENGDGFMDQPLDRQLIVGNRWFWFLDKGWEWQWGAKFTYLENTGGQMDYQRERVPQPGLWGYLLDLSRKEAWMKIGKIFLSQPNTSIGLQLAYIDHDQNALYGLRRHLAKQKSVYANLIFQTSSPSNRHLWKAGMSGQWDQYTESLDARHYDSEERVPGIFAEYTWSPVEAWTFVAGLRADHHSIYGGFLSPRLHVRYGISEQTVLRASVGRAQRTARIFAENLGYLASHRQIEIHGDSHSDKPYGLNPEVSWNMGLNLTHKFRLNYRDGSFGVDYYHTFFQDQVVIDLEDPRLLRFYHLQGPSRAHSIQAQLDYEILRRLDFRLAYRWYQVTTAYHSGVKERPLISPHRLFANAGYETYSQWKGDLTVQLWGPARIPGSILHSDYSPAYLTMNAQITKAWKDHWEVYFGVENLTNYKMSTPIMGADRPFEPGFDASMIWGPVMGRNAYLGLRLRWN